MNGNRRYRIAFIFCALVGSLAGIHIFLEAPSPDSPSTTPLARDADLHVPARPDAAGRATTAAMPTPEEVLRRVSGTQGSESTSAAAGKLSAALDHHLVDTRSLLQALEGAAEDEIPHLKRLLESKQAEFQTLQQEADRWLDAHGLSGSALSLEVAARFGQTQAVIDGVLAAAETQARGEAIRAAIQALRRLHPPRIGVRGEPQPTYTLDKGAAPNSDDISDAPPPAYAAPTQPPQAAATETDDNTWLEGIGIASARAAPAATAAEAAACNNAAADLGSALPEVDVGESEILRLAEALEYSPLRIYAYVKNNIAFEPYYGSLKGALGTLKSGAGNSTDQASLLIALLRASNIPARYVTGEIRFQSDDDRYPDWLGVKTFQAAIARLQAGGIPTPPYSNQFVHVWAQACVPYDNYRGSGGDNSGFRWIPLDPSFKEMTYTDGPTVADIPSFVFDYADYLRTRTNIMPHKALRDQMEAAMGGPLANGGGHRGTMLRQDIDILPATLPYEVVSFKAWSGTTASETAALPAAHRYRAEFELKNAAGQTLVPKLGLDMPLLATRRFTLSFQGATQADRDALGGWQGMELPCAVQGSADLQAGMQAVYRLEGADVTPAGTTRSVGFCVGDNQLAIRLLLNGQNVRGTGRDIVYKNIGAHNHHALQVYAFQASERFLEARAAGLLAEIGANPDPNALRDEILGEYLHLVGLKYMGYITRAGKEIGLLHGETGDSGNHIGLTATAMKVEYLFDLPFAVTRGGLLVDVPGALSRSRNLETGASDFAAFLLSGFAGSAYESYIWQEHAQLDAVSTVRGIQFANDAGVPVVELTSAADVDAKLNQGCGTVPYDLNYGESLKVSLRGLFTSGYSRVTVPSCLIHYDDWLGAVWVSEYQAGGAFQAGYTIAGHYVAGGGYTLGGQVPLAYDPSRGTGFNNLISEGIVGEIFRDQSVQAKFPFPELGNGSGSGYVLNETNLSGDPVNLLSGNLFHREPDLRLKGRGGLDIVFERVYNSHLRKDGPLGYGWTHSFNHYLKFYDTSGNGRTDQVVWVDGTGALRSFQVTGGAGGVPANSIFTNQPGAYATARREAGGEYSIREKGGLTFHFQNVTGMPGDTARLLRIEDRNGNALALGYDAQRLISVTDALGRGLDFHYDDGDGHITRVVERNGRTFRYGYLDGNLERVESPLAMAGQAPPTVYAYYAAADGMNLDHAMKSFTYPNGYRMAFEYYTNGKVFRHTNGEGKSFTFRYNVFRRETTTTDERGISQSYRFNEWGQQVEHVQGDGSRLRYEYSDGNHPLHETARRHALGYQTRYQYDSAGNLAATTLPDGSSLLYAGRNAYHLPTRVRDANGNYTLYRYDGRGNRAETIVLKAGVDNDSPAPGDILSWTVDSHDEHGNLLRSRQVRDFTTGAGPYVEYVYDAQGLNPITVKRCGLQQDAAGALVDQCLSAGQRFDALGRPVEVVDGAFYPARMEYDAEGRVARATDATGQWRDFVYDASGHPAGESLVGRKPDGKVGFYVHDTIEYDALDRPATHRNAAGFASRTEYDAVGNMVRITNPDGYSIQFEYDAMNRPLRAFDEQGHAVVTEYDIGGRPIRVTDPNGNSTSYAYYGAEENGRLRHVTTADNRSLEYFYDNNGNVVRTLDNAGRETLIEYDALNRPLRTVGPEHNSYIGDGQLNVRLVTRTTYNSLGYVSTIEAGYTTQATGDVLAVQAVYVYDDFGRLVEKTDANGNSTRHVYDGHGNLVRTESPNGHIVEYEYDHARDGLLIRRTARLSAGDAHPHVTRYDYNALGQITRVVAPEVTYTYIHDQANRLATVTDSRGGKTLRYHRSPGGLLNSVEDSEGRRSDFLYDATGRLTAMLAPGGERVNFVFDAGGRLRETQTSNGVGAQYRYDAGNRLTRLVNRTAQGIVSQHDYGYDSLGRREAHTEMVAGVATDYRYVHDEVDRLTQVLKDGGASLVEEYRYDQFGNRRVRNAADGTAHHYQYDAAQQLTSIKEGSDAGALDASFDYDANGNLIAKSEGATTRSLTYDALERVVQVEGSDIITESYQYDHQDRRIEKRGGTTQRYVYSGMSIWSEYGDSWDAALAHYAYTGLDQPIIRSTPNAADTRFYHHDGLGSAVAASNGAGAIAASARYDAWGNVTAGGGIPQFGFTGREPDATGLIFYRMRYYDPGIGRFAQRDPLGFADGINPYAYVGSSPQNFTDPLGLAAQAPMVLEGAAYVGADSIRWLDAGISAVKMGVGTFSPFGEALVQAAEGNWSAAVESAAWEAGAMAAGAVTMGLAYGAYKAYKNSKRALAAVEHIDEIMGAAKDAPIILGENMKRVQAYADKVGGKTINDFILPGKWSMEANEAWIKQMKNEGRIFVDTGPDFARRSNRLEQGIRPDAPAYNLERMETREYGGYESVFERTGKFNGGVKGLDY